MNGESRTGWGYAGGDQIPLTAPEMSLLRSSELTAETKIDSGGVSGAAQYGGIEHQKCITAAHFVIIRSSLNEGEKKTFMINCSVILKKSKKVFFFCSFVQNSVIDGCI